MSNRAVVLRKLHDEVKLTYHILAQLLGCTEKAVGNRIRSGIVPESQRGWLSRVREIRLASGRAVIVLDMPYSTPRAIYRREKTNGAPAESAGTP